MVWHSRVTTPSIFGRKVSVKSAMRRGRSNVWSFGADGKRIALVQWPLKHRSSSVTQRAKLSIFTVILSEDAEQREGDESKDPYPSRSSQRAFASNLL